MPLWDCGGERGGERSKNCWRVHSRGIVGIHTWAEGLWGSDALGIRVVHGIFSSLVLHGDIAVERGHVYPSIGHECVVWIFG